VGDLNKSGLKISVRNANATDTFLTKNFLNATVVRYATDPDAFNALKSGQVDANCSADATLLDFLTANWNGQGRLLDRLFVNHFFAFLHAGQEEGACYLSDYFEVAKTSGLIANAQSAGPARSIRRAGRRQRHCLLHRQDC
jgi:Bacterial extracellular solute-binding proteins, family 3